MHGIETCCVYYSDSPNFSEIHGILSRFMSYCHNSGEIKAQELLTTVLESMPSDTHAVMSV